MKITSRLRFLVLSCAAGLALAVAPSVSAAEVTPVPRADKALPLSHVFEKVESKDGTPFVLKVKNDSKETLKLSGRVLLAVVNHAMDKARKLPEQTLAPGETWTISGLTADDRVQINAAGYAELEIRVPFKI